MTHVRKQIRDAIAAKLIGLPNIGTNVFTNRTKKITNNILPCLIIETAKENSEAASVGTPRLVKRVLLVNIRVLTKATEDIDDVLDAICLDVEKQLALSPDLGGLTKDLKLESTDFSFDSENETTYGEAAMLWSADYQTKDTAPDTAL